MDLDDADAAVRLRFGVLDVVNGGGEGAFANPDDPLGHVIGMETAVGPDHTHNRDIDVRQDVGRSRRDRSSAENRDQ
jgi:hypothetical protein